MEAVIRFQVHLAIFTLLRLAILMRTIQMVHIKCEVFKTTHLSKIFVYHTQINTIYLTHNVTAQASYPQCYYQVAPNSASYYHATSSNSMYYQAATRSPPYYQPIGYSPCLSYQQPQYSAPAYSPYINLSSYYSTQQ